VSQLDSKLEGRGFESHPIVNGNVFKAMPGSIVENKEITGSQMGRTKKNIFF